ncbi:hypothetical protein ABPG72_019959 [Tetrahymena utriculariae]
MEIWQTIEDTQSIIYTIQYRPCTCIVYIQNSDQRGKSQDTINYNQTKMKGILKKTNLNNNQQQNENKKNNNKKVQIIEGKEAQIEQIETSISQIAGQQGVALLAICESNLTEDDKRRHSMLARQFNNYKEQQTARMNQESQQQKDLYDAQIQEWKMNQEILKILNNKQIKEIIKARKRREFPTIQEGKYNQTVHLDFRRLLQHLDHLNHQSNIGNQEILKFQPKIPYKNEHYLQQCTEMQNCQNAAFKFFLKSLIINK